MSLAEIACAAESPKSEPPDLGMLIDPASRPDPYPILGALREASPAPRPTAWSSSAGTGTVRRSCATRA